MLLLARSDGQSISIGADIIIKVCKIRGGQVVLGIEAPPEVEIFREEVKKKIENENKRFIGSYLCAGKDFKMQ